MPSSGSADAAARHSALRGYQNAATISSGRPRAEGGGTDTLHPAARSGIQTELEISPNFARLPRVPEIAIFRIIQESLTNIHRHSGSAKASIRLALDGNQIFCTISDQGKGMPSEATLEEPKKNRKLGVGIAGMRERVLQLGGQFEVAKGNPETVIKAVFPSSALLNSRVFGWDCRRALPLRQPNEVLVQTRRHWNFTKSPPKSLLIRSQLVLLLVLLLLVRRIVVRSRRRRI